VSNYTILLPPSEDKASGGTDNRSWLEIAHVPTMNSFSALNEARHTLIKALHLTLNQPEPMLEQIFRVKGDTLAAAVEANWRLPGGPILAAVRRYTGVMYDHLDYVNMSRATREAFEKNAILFSGVWGILRPTDLIPDYKLKIDAKLPDLGKVSTYWKPHISSHLNALVKNHVVWDLLPGAHRQAWDGKAKARAHWQIKFVQAQNKNGAITYRTVSHWSKALKGALVRFICEHDITEPADFAGFDHPEGYIYSPELSHLDRNSGEVVFLREWCSDE
jgi:cytoplasmic iron level regulating protein YaaA (DUF328/UPF0246 family)